MHVFCHAKVLDHQEKTNVFALLRRVLYESSNISYSNGFLARFESDNFAYRIIRLVE